MANHLNWLRTNRFPLGKAKGLREFLRPKPTDFQHLDNKAVREILLHSKRPEKVAFLLLFIIIIWKIIPKFASWIRRIGNRRLPKVDNGSRCFLTRLLHSRVTQIIENCFLGATGGVRLIIGVCFSTILRSRWNILVLRLFFQNNVDEGWLPFRQVAPSCGLVTFWVLPALPLLSFL